MPLALRSLSDNRNRARVRPVGLRIRLRVCHLAVYFDWSLLTARDALTRRQRPLMVLKKTFVHTYVGGRKADLPREVGPTPGGKVNATAQNELCEELADERWKRACWYDESAVTHSSSRVNIKFFDKKWV